MAWPGLPWPGPASHIVSDFLLYSSGSVSTTLNSTPRIAARHKNMSPFFTGRYLLAYVLGAHALPTLCSHNLDMGICTQWSRTTQCE